MNIKKIIAREGLVLLGIMLVGLLFFFVGVFMSNVALIGEIGYFILVLGYPAYLLIRFILWAVKTLKGK